MGGGLMVLNTGTHVFYDVERWESPNTKSNPTSQLSRRQRQLLHQGLSGLEPILSLEGLLSMQNRLQ